VPVVTLRRAEQPTEYQLEEVHARAGDCCCYCHYINITSFSTLRSQESGISLMDGDVTAATVTLAPWLKGSVQESVRRLMMR
jgi:hypothetical protein